MAGLVFMLVISQPRVLVVCGCRCSGRWNVRDRGARYSVKLGFWPPPYPIPLVLARSKVVRIEQICYPAQS